MSTLPYRPNVGIVLLNQAGKVLIGRRLDGQWQLPQGGIEEGEDLRQAVMRELQEELGTDKAEIIGEHPDWLSYDVPPGTGDPRFIGKYRGQTQRWFALRFFGTDSDIKLDDANNWDDGTHQEFFGWRWLRLTALPIIAARSKRDIYMTVARSFAHLVPYEES